MYDDPSDIAALRQACRSTSGDSAYEKRDCIRPILRVRWQRRYQMNVLCTH